MALKEKRLVNQVVNLIRLLLVITVSLTEAEICLCALGGNADTSETAGYCCAPKTPGQIVQ